MSSLQSLCTFSLHSLNNRTICTRALFSPTPQGWLTLLQAVLFYASWRQLGDETDAAWCPFGAAEVLNIVGSAGFAATSIMYIFGGDASALGVQLADVVVCIECAANFAMLWSAVLYFRVSAG